ncbi:hypothetical protein FRC07_008919 [Ceratobasidium sp. 392]|nr:hypothetical protein FRC07_008919 [Ceratobasidium sp. 392]
MAENWPLDINIYGDSILNLVHVINHAVNLDIGNPRFPNVFRDPSLLKDVIVPNPAPVGISLDQWVGNDNKTLYYGSIPSGYGTWAEALLDGKPFTLRNVTGLPPNPVMDTTYQCPMYRAKSISSLLTSVFVGTATMVTSAWAAWMFFAAFLAKRMAAPRVQCHCNQCEKRREKERRDEEANVGSFSQAELLLRLAALEELVKLPFNVEDQKKFDPGLANTPTGDQRNPLDVTDLSYNSRSTTGEH